MWGFLICFSLGLTEALLRAGFRYRVEHGPPPGFGTNPEILARLFYAYHGGNFSMLAPGSDATVLDRRRGYRRAPNLTQRNENGGALSTNSRGIRGAREFALPKPVAVIRVVALGDSFTFGESVNDADTWPAQLEASFENLEVANLGERGYAHDQMYFALVDDGLPLEPDVVILGFYENDVWRDELTYYAYEKPRFSRGPDGWYIENVPIPTPEELKDRYLRMPLIYATARGLFDVWRDPMMSLGADGERAREILRRIRQRTEDAGARFVMVNLPGLHHPDPPAPTTANAPPPNFDFFSDYCTKTNTECVDTWPLFRAAASTAEERMRRFQRANDMHYSRDGYAVVAEALRRHFTEHPMQRGVPRQQAGRAIPRP